MPLSFIMTSLWFFSGYILGEDCLPSLGNEYRLLNTFKFVKAVSDIVFDMMNAVCHVKPLIFIGLRFGRSSSPIIGQ